MPSHHTGSHAETVRAAGKIAHALRGGPGPLVVALTGELGAGKTCFAGGFLHALGVKENIKSPTFVIMKTYKTQSSNVHHLDAYRLSAESDLSSLQFPQLLKDPQAIFLIEWAENIKHVLPAGTIWIRFEHGKKENERTITYENPTTH